MVNVGRQAGHPKLLQGRSGSWPHDFFASGTQALEVGAGVKGKNDVTKVVEETCFLGTF